MAQHGGLRGGGDTKRKEHPRVLRLDFPPYGEGLQDIDWDAWFRTFDERNLIFMFQEHLRNGRQSNFFRLANPEHEDT